MELKQRDWSAGQWLSWSNINDEERQHSDLR